MNSHMTSTDMIRFMKRHGIDKHQLAHILGVTAPAVDHWVRSRRPIPGPVANFMAIVGKYPGLLAELTERVKGAAE